MGKAKKENRKVIVSSSCFMDKSSNDLFVWFFNCYNDSFGF